MMNHITRRASRPSAFTLIELLVVIAIIAILAAILFPVFGRARENARRSSCQSNIKQIGLGFAQYTQDYDEKYPQVATGGLNGAAISATNTVGWVDSLQPYLKSTQIFQCPSETNAPTTTGTAGFSDYWYNGFIGDSGRTYGTTTTPTVAGGNGGGAATTNGGLSQASLNASALTVLMGDGDATASTGTNTNVWNKGTGGYAVNDVWTTTASGSIGPDRRHLDGSNYGFADGHAKWLKPEKITNKFTTSGEPTLNPA
jgi:prepilin-type N-terminal cleavage/methylation domain-containing protein/prepilin-type processing-associated H-X9-DG protein